MDVRIDCPCPARDGQTRHPDGDTVTLRERLGWEAAATAKNAVMLARAEDPDLDPAEILTILTRIYLLQGVEAWTLTDAEGRPLPVTKPNIRTHLLSDQDTAITLGEAADDLYAEAVMLPLLRQASSSSAGTPTETSTSPMTGSEPPSPPTPSTQSWTSTTPMAATATTSSSPDGVSS